MTHRIATLLAAATVVGLAGCGDSGSGGSPGAGADPAKVVPADAAAYIEAVVRPDGDVKDSALDALKKILRSDDPGSKITGALDKALAKEGSSWDDVKEWLGERAGAFISDVRDGKPVAAAVIDITDRDKAKDFLDKLASKKPKGALKSGTYKGVAITYDDKVSHAVTDDYAVIGTLTGTNAVIDTMTGRQPLSDVADYTATRSTLNAGDALGIVYAQPQRILDLLDQVLPKMQASGAPGATQFASPQFAQVARQLIGSLGRAAGAALHADGDAVRIDAAGLGNHSPDNPAGADQVAALPDDAWLAIGFSDLGKSATKALNQFSRLSKLSAAAAGGSGTGMPNLNGALDGITKKAGIDLKRDLLSWMGAGAVYARGHSLLDIGAVLTVKTKDAAKSRRAVKLIGRALTQRGRPVTPATVAGYDTAIKVSISDSLPVALIIAANDQRFSIGVNPQALSDVNAPPKTFGDSNAYKTASSNLGGDLRPVFVLDFPSVVSLLESFGLSNNPGFAKVKPYLDAYGSIAGGSVHDGDVARFTFSVGLR